MYSLIIHDNDTDPSISPYSFEQAKKIINESRYRERFGLSHREMLEEPLPAIKANEVIWDLDNQRQEMERKKPNPGQTSGIDST